jgi:hypothetical protein
VVVVTVAVSMVSTVRATDAALSTAERVTLTGSMTPTNRQRLAYDGLT